MNLSRIHRIVKLLGLLQSSQGMHAGELATECGVSRRTIFRDLDALRQAGVPLVFDNQRQEYHIPGVFFLPPTNFTPDEALAVISLCHELGDQSLPFFDGAASAAIKLENSLPTHLREFLRSRSSAISIRIDAANPLAEKNACYRELVNAIADKRQVRIQYDSFTEGEPITTKLHPYQLLFHSRSWYVIGRSSLHRSIRTFNVGRIGELETLNERYKTPQGFNVKRHLRNAWRMIPEKGPDAEIQIHFLPKVARNVAEVMWHPTQRIEFREDGSLDFYATVSGLEEISWWILGYGDQAEVLAPTELRQKIKQRAQGMMKLYGN